MGSPDLPPELARLRRFDEAMHRAALRNAGFTGPQSRVHLQSEMRERDAAEAAELRTPAMPPARDAAGRSGQTGKARRKAKGA